MIEQRLRADRSRADELMAGLRNRLRPAANTVDRVCRESLRVSAIVFEIPLEVIAGSLRTDPVVQARCAAALLAREQLPEISQTALAQGLGQKRSAVSYQVKAAKNRVEQEPKFRAKVDFCRSQMAGRKANG
ncbi:MAG: hypothetical protein WCO67_24585 [Betaproteobacteria bacterium]